MALGHEVRLVILVLPPLREPVGAYDHEAPEDD